MEKKVKEKETKLELKDGTQIRFVNLSRTEVPVYVESSRSDWIVAGEENEMFENLIKYSIYSSTHQSILKTKIDAVSGDRIIFEEGDENFEPNQSETLDELADKLAADLEIVGAYAIEVILSVSKDRVAEMNHIPIQNLRYAKANSNGDIKGMYYSRDWTNTRKNKPVPIPFYNKYEKQTRSLFLKKKYWPGSDYLIMPSYYSSLKYIKIDNEISQFHLSSLQGGMNPGLILSLNNGQYQDPEKAEKMVKALEKKYKGSSNAGQMMILFNQSKEQAADIKQLEQSNLHEMFNILVNSVSQQILTAHQLTNPQLAGIKTPGELGGGGQQLLQSYELFYNNVILPDQKLLQNGLNKILKINGIEISIKNTSSMKFSFSEKLLQDNLNNLEIREMIGYDAMELTEEKPEEEKIEETKKEE